MSDPRESDRYPYTYAYDWIRRAITKPMFVGPEFGGQSIQVPALSRSDAAQIVGVIADAIEIPKENIAIKMADKYLEEEAQ